MLEAYQLNDTYSEKENYRVAWIRWGLTCPQKLIQQWTRSLIGHRQHSAAIFL